MKLISISMIKDEEYWIWYALTSVAPHVDEVLVFDNHSTDQTCDIVRGMGHLGDKLTLFEGFGGDDEQENRQAMLEEARRRGATHVLTLDGDEVYADDTLAFTRRLLEVHEHYPALNDPPQNHGKALDPTPTDGVLPAPRLLVHGYGSFRIQLLGSGDVAAEPTWQRSQVG